MASQSALRARVATIRDLLAPDTSKRPCVTVQITKDPPPQGLLLLTAGEGPPAESPSPPPPPEAGKRPDGHVCGPRCVSVSINYSARHTALADTEPKARHADPPALPPGYGDDAVGAPSRSGRGDVQRLPESAAAGRDVEPQSGPPRSPPPAAEPGAARVEAPARDQVVEVERTDRPAVAYPIGALELERRQEAAAVARALSQDLQSITPWWLPVARVRLGLCAVPYCEHPAEEHRGIRTRLPCGYCGFQADQHDPDGIALEVPYASRRATPCSLYRAIYVDEVDSDKCEVLGCGCRGWRRVPPDPRSELSMLKARLEEKDRIIASNEQKLARLREEREAAERQLLRATSKPNDLGAAPRTCPTYSEGDSA